MRERTKWEITCLVLIFMATMVGLKVGRWNGRAEMKRCYYQSHPVVKEGSKPDDPSAALMKLSKAEMELSKAEMELSKAEESAGQLEDRLARCWMVTAIVLFSLSGLAALALGLSLIYEKYTYG